MKLKKLGELKFIERVKQIFSGSYPDILCGIGDDAAVLKFGNKKLLFTIDALLEKVHFDWKWTHPYLLGRKSLSVNLSDIAAMGGVPLFVVVSVAVPSDEKVEKVLEFCQGLKSVARQFKVKIVGGDTDRSKNGWKITIALIGEAKKPVYRSGAKTGDHIWVTGCPGSSALGLELLRYASRDTRYASCFIQSHLNPIPRIREGKILAEKNLVSSMIDVSDGLLLDLEHLCSASKVGAKIHTDSFLISENFRESAKKLKKDPLKLILTGGEDYELLFTSSPKNERKLVQLFRKLKTPLTQIGEIMGQKYGMQVFNEVGKKIKIHQKGFVHF